MNKQVRNPYSSESDKDRKIFFVTKISSTFTVLGVRVESNRMILFHRDPR